MRNSEWMLAIAVFVFAAGTAGADTLRVPKDYDTIQEAVDAAGAGDTIKVSKGSYPELVVVEGKTDLRIHASRNSLLTVGGEAAISILDSSDIEVRGFTLEGNASYGVFLARSADVENSRCVVDGAGIDGFHTDDCARVRFERCLARDCGTDGFSLSGSDDREENATVDSAILKCTTIGGDDDGIAVNGHRDLVDGCKIVGPNDDGIIVIDEHLLSEDNVIRRCKVVGANLNGFDVRGTQATLTRNVSKEAGGDGFRIAADATGNTLDTNKASASDGLDLNDQAAEGANSYVGKNKFNTSSR